MARNVDQVIAGLPAKRQARIERRAGQLATLKDLRQAVERTQEELAASLGVGQDTLTKRGGLNLSRHRLSVDQFHEMGRAGILSHDARVELIDGEIIRAIDILEHPP